MEFNEGAPDALMDVHDWRYCGTGYCGTDELELLKPEFRPTSYVNESGFQKRLNASQIFHWVQRVLDNVEWMKNVLPSEYRMMRDLEKV